LIGKDGTVYIGSADGFMYAIQDMGTSGRRAWAYKTAGPVTSSPVIDKAGYLYFASSDTDNRVIGVDALSGTAKRTPAGTAWTFTASAGIQGGLALSADESSVVLGDVNGNVYSVNTSTATSNWTYSTGSVVYSAAPLIATIGGQAAVIVGATEGKLHAISLTAGTSVWADAVDLEGQIYSSAAISPDGTTIYIATFDNTSGLDRSRVLAINAADGTHKWNTATLPTFNPGFTSSPAVSFDGSKLYIGCYDGKLYGVNTTDGSVAWAFTPTAADEYFDSSPAIGADGTLYIGGVSGTFYAVK
jgi:outer membrane protein assembly factor BamB